MACHFPLCLSAFVAKFILRSKIIIKLSLLKPRQYPSNNLVIYKK
jgi:hypothetical protein